MQIVYVIVVLVLYAFFLNWISKFLFRRAQIIRKVTSYALNAFEKAKEQDPSRKAEFDRKAQRLRDWADSTKSR